MLLSVTLLLLPTLPLQVYQNELPVGEIRKILAETPRHPYLPLLTPPLTKEEATTASDSIMESQQWKLGSTTASIATPIQWVGYPRSFAFHFHAWESTIPFFEAASQGGGEKYFQEGHRFALEWMQVHIPPTRSITTTEALDAAIGQPEEFAWYDMGVGLRIYPLAWLLSEIARRPDTSDEEIALFVDGLYFHMEALGRKKFFKAHNNHGLFQAVGQLAAARKVPNLPKIDEYTELALARLEKIVGEQYSPSGVHREHSPGYHEMLMRTFLAMRQMDMLHETPLQGMISGMEEALTWMVDPDFKLATFGDTSYNPIFFSERLLEQLRNDQLRYLISQGRDGIMPGSGVRAYPDVGYAFARTLHADGDFARSSYLAQMSAFHSRTHKHADHLTFIWHEHGHPILVDAGRYGYVGRTEPGSDLRKAGFWYSDPNRMYVESTRAHNVVEIDGQDYPRAGVKPFGSALKAAEQQGELIVFESRVSYSETQHHRRLLVSKPREFLLVIDDLDDEVPHTYTQRFTFAPHWNVSLEGDTLKATPTASTEQAEPSESTRPTDLKPLYVKSLLAAAKPIPVARGQKEPRMQGWHSHRDNQIIPASSIGFEEEQAATGRFVTLFAFADELTADPTVQKIEGMDGATNYALTWQADGKTIRVKISAPKNSGEDEYKPARATLEP